VCAWALSGLDTEGIYRHSGSISKIQKLRIQANQGMWHHSISIHLPEVPALSKT